ncbi:putative pyridoxamine phosphate oxidase family protein [Eutypa lata UCREL1]|uniref:Putative pyridoxamine phosphate oxidase family protein n=1 Tax=Eutypa lata (strain UCR-EL1) TaxID=1287681 RepID=M7T7Y1_EUTLA|nr:putative pyridoxamine phosphate oxidase family protein [Eutypa lata UCREL1]
MGVFYEAIPKSLYDWILKQKVFWVATAPLSNNGHVNVSPKGGPYFGLVDEKTFCNGRITIMFNAFDGPPKIVRLWGKGRALEYGTAQFEDFVTEHHVNTLPGTRSIIIVDIHQVGSSCGFSVPIFDFKEHRQILNDFMAKKEEKFKAGNEKESFDRYWAFKNAWSMDMLPGMKRGLAAADVEKVEPIKKMVAFW